MSEQEILANELHKPVRTHFPTRRVVVNGIDSQWQLDLVEMQQYAKENNGYRYMLTVIDILSKRAWAVPLKNKTGIEVADALKSIFKERKPQKIQVDQGKEFYNKTV